MSFKLLELGIHVLKNERFVARYTEYHTVYHVMHDSCTVKDRTVFPKKEIHYICHRGTESVYSLNITPKFFD